MAAQLEPKVPPWVWHDPGFAHSTQELGSAAAGHAACSKRPAPGPAEQTRCCFGPGPQGIASH